MPPKRRRRFQGLYYHSSPPKVLPMNGQSSNQGRKRRDIDDFSVKLSTIRIWMHEKDIGKLTRILWAGQGSRLCQQASTNPRVKRFLAAVPYVMNSIKDVHQAVIDNNLETLQAKMEPPVPPALITCRDANGLNLIHKAAGLGHTKILEYLIGIWPDGVAETDVTGKTPLHWAASHKNNMRCYTLLTEAGCDEEALDYKMKSPTYYRHKPHEIERAFLVYVPEAPRVSPDVATDWEALSEDIGDGGKKLDIKIPDTNGFHGRTTDDSIENTSEVDLNDGISATEEEQHAAAITNGDGDESAPQTPAKDDEEAPTEAEEGGEVETPLTNGDVEADDVNGHDEAAAEAEADEEAENAEAAEAGDEADEEANAEAGEDAAAEADVKADTQAAPEVETTEAETNMKALNDTTTTTTNGSEEHAEEQGKSEAATTAVDESKDAAESENVETKVDEVAETEKVEERKEESEEKIAEESATNEKKEVEEINEDTENLSKDEVEQKTDDKKEEEQTENETKEIEIKENEIKDEATDIDSKNEEKKVSELSIEPRIESGDKQDSELKQVEETKEEKTVSETEQEKTETEAKSSDKEEDERESKAVEVEQEVEKIEDPTSDFETPKLVQSVKDAVKTAAADITDYIKDIVNGVREDVDTKQEEVEEVNKVDEEKENTNGNDNEENKGSEIESKTNEKESLDNEKENENATNKGVAEETESNDEDKDIQKNKETENDEVKEVQEDNTEKSTEKATEGDKEIEAEAVEATKTNGTVETTEEKVALSDEKEEKDENKNENENKSGAITAESNEHKIDKDEENKTNNDDTKSAQPDTTTKEPPDTTNEKNDEEKITQEAPNANDKTEEEDVNQKTNEDVVEMKEKTTTEEHAMPQNGDIKVTPQEQNKETGEIMSKEKLETIEEYAISNSEQVGGKIPRLTTAKLSRGKRNGSGKKKTDTLLEGENESEGEYDEDDEDEESEIREAIDAGDMEQLAQIVLNGDGNKLVNLHSHNPDIQAFLSNVPNYMTKIRRVHEASREGSLLALQQALDRRKFAIAKDEISPNGATPLHVAVLFGNTDIVRYLAARFPETTTTTDNDGRTALHYAATINDNGHFYNVLTQLGANSKALDKFGHTPEFYQNKEEAKDILNYKKLLSNFGAEELEDELLNDQGQAENASSQMNPIFKTEQGKYLANNLADPLIKALTEIANKRPEDPVAFLANYLQNYLHQRDPTEKLDSGKTNSTATVTSQGMVRRTGMGLRSASNINGDEDRIEEDHISNADEEEDTQANVDDRDEHGQSMLHFACARSHRRGALMHLIEESNIDITYRDELYRTARDVSLQANQPSNAKDIDRYVLSLAVIGDVKPFETLAVEGYDHIVDVTDDNELSIVDIAAERGHDELANFLRNLRTLEELREELHQMIRDGNVGRAKEIVAEPNGKWFLKAKNYYGRTALHIAVLKENEELVEHFVNIYPEALKIGDNLERTVLHYAMGTNAIESLSRILIQKGAKRTNKDLKGRQPSYYFMNKADILRLQEEEEENR